MDDGELIRVFQSGDLETVKCFMSENDCESYLNLEFKYACKGGNMYVVRFLIEKGADYLDGGFYEACKGGHIDIVNLMIDKGVSNWSVGVYIAGDNGHRDIVDLMLEKSNGKIRDKYTLLCNSINFKWIDLIVRLVYKVDLNWRLFGHKNQFKYRYDILDIYNDKYKNIVNVKVKLFDRNLFK